MVEDEATGQVEEGLACKACKGVGSPCTIVKEEDVNLLLNKAKSTRT